MNLTTGGAARVTDVCLELAVSSEFLQHATAAAEASQAQTVVQPTYDEHHAGSRCDSQALASGRQARARHCPNAPLQSLRIAHSQKKC